MIVEHNFEYLTTEALTMYVFYILPVRNKYQIAVHSPLLKPLQSWQPKVRVALDVAAWYLRLNNNWQRERYVFF